MVNIKSITAGDRRILGGGAIFTPLFFSVVLLLLAPDCGRAGRATWSDWVAGPCGGPAEYTTFHSDSVGGDVSYHVMLPRSYANDHARRYPVIYWLHGTGGGCRGVEVVADHCRKMMDSGEMPETIVVFPNGLGRGMWCDSRDGSRRPESMLVRDLVPHVDSTYRTQASRHGRAIEGFSMGGYGAGRIGFKHGDTFGCVTMYGAGPLHTNFLENDPNLQPLEARQKLFRHVYGSDADYYIENLPQTQVLKILESSHLREAPDIRIVVGEDDPLRDNNKSLSSHLTGELGIEHSYSEVEGVGHDAAGLLEAVREETGAFYRRNFR